MNKKQLLDTLNERPTFTLKEKRGNIKLVEIKKIGAKLKRIENKLNKKFVKDDLIIKLDFSSKEELETNYDMLYVTLYHSDLMPTGSYMEVRKVDLFILQLLELRILKWVKQYLIDYLE